MTVTANTNANALDARHLTSVAKMQAIIAETRQLFVDRDDAALVIATAWVCKKNVLILGPKGTAKTELFKSIAERIEMPTPTNGTHTPIPFFAKLMTKFSTEDHLFGPPDFGKLHKESVFVRKTDHTAADSLVVFLDEIYKSGPTIQNPLLEWMNTGIYDNGQQRVQTPVQMIVAASNEGPQSEEQAPFQDRFHFTLYVAYVQPDHFAGMIKAASVHTLGMAGMAHPTRIGYQELLDLQALVPTITIPDRVLKALAKLHQEFLTKKFVISDRRWVQSLDIMRASAILNGRSVVNEGDMQILEHVLFDAPEQKKYVSAAILRVANPGLAALRAIYDNAASSYSTAQATAQDCRSKAKQASGQEVMILTGQATAALAGAMGDLNECKEKLLAKRVELDSQSLDLTKVDSMLAEIDEWWRKLASDMITSPSALSTKR